MSTISILRDNTVTVTESQVQRARAWFNESADEDKKLVKGPTPKQVILDYIAAGEPDVIVPDRTYGNKPLVADKDERKAFRAWAKENGYERNKSTVQEWEAAGKPVPESVENSDVSATLVVRKLDSLGRPTGKTFQQIVTKDEVRAVRKGKRGRPSFAELMDFGGVGVQVQSIETSWGNVILEDGKLPTTEQSLKAENERLLARIAELEAEVEELTEENAAFASE